jgi:hypothetical protein
MMVSGSLYTTSAKTRKTHSSPSIVPLVHAETPPGTPMGRERRDLSPAMVAEPPTSPRGRLEKEAPNSQARRR